MTNLAELFDGMPARFQADKAADTDMTLMFDMTGDGGGQWCVKIADGKLDVHEGARGCSDRDGQDGRRRLPGDVFRQPEPDDGLHDRQGQG